MTTVKYVLSVIALGLILTGYPSFGQAGSDIPDEFNQPYENLITGGQPSQIDLALFKDAGITKVINLRGPDEAISFDEKMEVEALGLEYISLPIAGAGDVTIDNAKALYQLLQGDDKVLLHCASGNRVGALLALGAHEAEGKPVAESLTFGRAAGLGSLEPRVQAILSGQSQK